MATRTKHMPPPSQQPRSQRRRKWLCVSALLIIMGVVPSAATAATQVPSRISTSTTWEASASPYIVSSAPRTSIAPGATLTIDPGVVVKFETGAALDVYGAIRAQGTRCRSIVFEPTGPITESESWGSLQLLNPSVASTFTHIDMYSGALSSDNSDVNITNSDFWFDGQISVSNSTGDPAHSWDSTFSDNHIFYGSFSFTLPGSTDPSGTLTIDNNVINHCEGCQGIAVPGSLGTLELEMSGNLIENVDNGIIVAGLGSPTITMNNNSVLDNAGSGFNINSVSSPGTVSMAGNNDFDNTGNCENCGPLVYKAGTGNVSATNNWWGTTNSSQIAAGIFDGEGHGLGGVVNYTPYLTSLSTSAPTPDTTSPDTMLGSGPPAETNDPNPTFGDFRTTKPGVGSTFQCQLDGEPWTFCPRSASYFSLADGSHTFDVRAVDADGNIDPTPASETFTVDTTPPVVTLTEPGNGSSTGDPMPMFSGTAGTASGDSSIVTIRIYRGSSATGKPVQKLMTTASGAGWSVQAATALAPGQYTATAEQGDAAGNRGFSCAIIFTVEVPPVVSPALRSHSRRGSGSRSRRHHHRHGRAHRRSRRTRMTGPARRTGAPLGLIRRAFANQATRYQDERPDRI